MNNGAQLLERKLKDHHVVGATHALSFCKDGRVTISNVFPPECIPIMQNAAERAFRFPLPVTRRALDPPGWTNVQRTTMFRYPVGWDQKLHSLSILSPELLVVARWTDVVCADLSQRLREIGNDTVADLVAGRPTNRVVVNRMKGAPEKPAEIAPHEDNPCEIVANIVAEFEPTEDAVTGEKRPGNVLTIFPSREVIDVIGIKPVEHGVVSHVTRFSAVFTGAPRTQTLDRGMKLVRDILPTGR